MDMESSEYWRSPDDAIEQPVSIKLKVLLLYSRCISCFISEELEAQRKIWGREARGADNRETAGEV